MRPIRLLILLLAIAVALVIALMRPLQGRAARLTRRHAPHPARHERAKWRQPMSHPAAEAGPAFGRRVVAYARRFLGVPYSYGGTSPRSGFDCSGFVRFVYGHFGIALPHSSFGDILKGNGVPRRFLRPGDLVFFSDASHVGIYVGGDHFIDAPYTGTVIRISTMNGWYSASYDGARRLHRG